MIEDDMELGVWRLLARTSELSELFGRLQSLLRERLPVDRALFRVLDPVSGIVEPLIGERTPGDEPASEMDRAELLTWAESGQLLSIADPQNVELGQRVAPAIDAPFALFVPLRRVEQGFPILAIGATRALSAGERSSVERLAAPMSVAVEHHSRLRALVRLQEAALADKNALLLKLQRQDISEAIVGDQTGLSRVMSLVDQVAPTVAPVLLLGETGSGKEVIARAIHSRSLRVRGPVLRVNCGAIAPELLDSELFGHDRGSFTGATTTRKGWFERADGGTLFLDEVAELPLGAQVRLLRVLQDGTLQRVGGERAVQVDVRIVAATHRNLEEMVHAGTFREDLYYRINTFTIRIPPLRRRREDIGALAEHFARQAGMRLAGAPLVPARRDLDILMSYRWPGNVRELAAVIERAAILGNGHRLDVAAALGDTKRNETSRTSSPPGRTMLTLDEVTARHIESVLSRTRGKIEGPDGAAALLDVNPHTLRARMRKMKIDWAAYRRDRADGAR